MAFYRECLKKELSRRKENNPNYSMRAFARSLALSPSTLCRVLAGTRSPSRDIALRIINHLKLSQKDAERFLLSAFGYAVMLNSDSRYSIRLNTPISDEITAEIEAFQQALSRKYGAKKGADYQISFILLSTKQAD